MNLWMLLACIELALIVSAVLALHVAAREFHMIDQALLRTLTDLYAARDQHANEIAEKDSAIRALEDTRDVLRQDFYRMTGVLPPASTDAVLVDASLTTH